MINSENYSALKEEKLEVIKSYQGGSASVVSFAYAAGFGPLNLMTMYPAPQLMRYPIFMKSRNIISDFIRCHVVIRIMSFKTV